MHKPVEYPEVNNPKTDMTLTEMKEFIRNHFEEFVNRKNLHIGEANLVSLCCRQHNRDLCGAGLGMRIKTRRYFRPSAT
jgi:hypothetical protein